MVSIIALEMDGKSSSRSSWENAIARIIMKILKIDLDHFEYITGIYIHELDEYLLQRLKEKDLLRYVIVEQEEINWKSIKRILHSRH